MSGIKQKGPFARGRSGGGKENATSSKARTGSASKSHPVTLEEASCSTAAPASISPPPTETSTEPALPKGTPSPPTTPQALHRTPPLQQLTPPPSQPPTPQVIDDTYPASSQSSTTCTKGRKKLTMIRKQKNYQKKGQGKPKKFSMLKTKTLIINFFFYFKLLETFICLKQTMYSENV